jgi:ParB family chromosome partitioning protein
MKSQQQVQMIPVDRVNVMNPRVRSKKIFGDIVQNISSVGLKKPITVIPSQSNIPGKDYDLVCGQGRVEAFIACGQSMIPAVVRDDVSIEDALVMSLVENVARRQHRALDLLEGIDILQKKGYSPKEIAAKTGLTLDYANGVLNLIERGEKRLLTAVESGKIPISVAVHIAQSPNDAQRALHEAYEKGLLRGRKLMEAKRLVDARQRRGKVVPRGGHGPRNRKNEKMSVELLMREYKRDVDQKRIFARKARQVGDDVTFVTEALRDLFKDEKFMTLLRAEKLNSMPKQLAVLVGKR